MEPLTFDEVKFIWNKVIPTIRERIDACALSVHLQELFATSTIQKMKAQENQHGAAIASDPFFEEAKTKPNSFTTILAALKKTQQPDILKEILKTILRERPLRFQEIVVLIRKAAQDLDVNVDEEIEAVKTRDNGAGQGSARQTKLKTPVRIRTEVPRQNEVLYQRGTQQNEHHQQQHQSASPVSPENNAPVYRVPIGQLKSTARKKISIHLNAVDPQQEQPVWQILLDEEEELNFNAEEASQIEESRDPGKKFYDKLMDFTTEQLFKMLQRHNFMQAAETVRQQSLEVAQSPQFKEDLAIFDENNLDRAIQISTQHQQQQFNIPMQQQRTSVTQGSIGGHVGTEPNNNESMDDNLNRTQEIGISFDEGGDGKGTRCIEAVGDRDNMKSTLHPEGERQKLIKDRVGQHDNSDSNLVSFNEVTKTSEKSKHVLAENTEASYDNTRALSHPELVGSPSQENIPISNRTPTHQQLGTKLSLGGSEQSPNPGTGSNSEETNVKVPLEHARGSAGYNEVNLDSFGKLHADTSQDELTTSMSSFTLDSSELNVEDNTDDNGDDN